MKLVASWVPWISEVLVFQGFVFVVGVLEPRFLFIIELQFLRMTQAWGGEGWGEIMGQGTCSSGASLLKILGASDSGSGELCYHTEYRQYIGIDNNISYHLLSAGNHHIPVL